MSLLDLLRKNKCRDATVCAGNYLRHKKLYEIGHSDFWTEQEVKFNESLTKKSLRDFIDNNPAIVVDYLFDQITKEIENVNA